MKWQLPSSQVQQTDFDYKAYWETSHAELDYGDVFSVTEDEQLLKRLSDPIVDLVGTSGARVLVPGCGSRGRLERHLVERVPYVHVVATDFERVVSVAASRFDHAQVEFLARDTRKLGYNAIYDAAVPVNSILSDDDSDNRAMIASTARAIRPGGIFVGLFPTIFGLADLSYCDPNYRNWLDFIDLHESRYRDQVQKQSQILYTPLRLRAILVEAGLVDIEISIFFCDSAHLRAEASRMYGIVGEDSVIYFLLVAAWVPN